MPAGKTVHFKTISSVAAPRKVFLLTKVMNYGTVQKQKANGLQFTEHSKVDFFLETRHK